MREKILKYIEKNGRFDQGCDGRIADLLPVDEGVIAADNAFFLHRRKLARDNHRFALSKEDVV